MERFVYPLLRVVFCSKDGFCKIDKIIVLERNFSLKLEVIVSGRSGIRVI